METASNEYFVHGATIALNTILQRNGSRVALFVTDGFRDILEIQRLRLKHPFDFNSTRPSPLVPRSAVFEVDERILSDGTVDRPLDEEGARAAIARACADGAEAFAVCLINSFRFPHHERRLGELLAEMAPDRATSLSIDVWPQIREYERAVATVMTAYTRSSVSDYLGRLRAVLEEEGARVRPYITKSNGGVMTIERAATAPAEMLLSGPASGVTGATFVAGQAGFSDLITLDIGGTSADIAIVAGGTAISSQEEHIGDFPLIIPTVAVSSIGAGGGSIARVDAAGVLKVGPDSAGADPGPACYGRGGTAPTITDAFVVAGLLDPDHFLGGRLRLDAELARRAVASIANRIGTDDGGAARAIITVATAAMYSEFSSLISKRGIDPRDFCLVAFGGAGPLVACTLAREFRIPTVLVPVSPGTLCALGALAADVTNDHIRSLNRRLDAVDPMEIASAFADMRREAEDWLRTEGPRTDASEFLLTADTRYEGQAYEIQIPVDESALRTSGAADIAAAHHRIHERVYAHADERSPIEVVNLRLRVIGRMPKPVPARRPAASGAPRSVGRRNVHVEGVPRPAAVYMRSALGTGHTFDGQAIVEQDDTTVFVPAAMRARVDDLGNLVISTAGRLTA